MLNRDLGANTCDLELNRDFGENTCDLELNRDLGENTCDLELNREFGENTCDLELNRDLGVNTCGLERKAACRKVCRGWPPGWLDDSDDESVGTAASMPHLSGSDGGDDVNPYFNGGDDSDGSDDMETPASGRPHFPHSLRPHAYCEGRGWKAAVQFFSRCWQWHPNFHTSLPCCTTSQ